MIHIPHDLPDIEYLIPPKPDFKKIFSAKPLKPFCNEVMAFLQNLSARLLKDGEAKDYPDVVSFAFWCRISALRAMKERYSGQQLCLGRGIVFHVAPSNVPVNFAYSLAAGLLAGNANIVRVPSRDYPQVAIICSAIRQLIEMAEYRYLCEHIILLRYEKNDAVTDFFSTHCDVRMIWGGDRTIKDIRRSILPARSFDLAFADRYSLCVINAADYPGTSDPARIALDFYNDTYLFDQNACTAPHLVVWLGDAREVAQAQEIFWSSLHQIVAEKYELQSVSAVDKLADAFRFAASAEGCSISTVEDNLIVRIRLHELKSGLEDVRSTCGFFYEYGAKRLDEIVPLVNRKFQTLAYFAIDPAALQKFVEDNRLTGIDRIVPIGRTLDFSLTWDGYDLISMLSRTVQIVC